MSLINCELSLILTWSENYVITSMVKRIIANMRRDVSPTGATFNIKDSKLYVPVVTLPTKDDNNFLEQLKWKFKRTINSFMTEAVII